MTITRIGLGHMARGISTRLIADGNSLTLGPFQLCPIQV